MNDTHKNFDKILDWTRKSLCIQICKQPAFFANGVDLIDRRETRLSK